MSEETKVVEPEVQEEKPQEEPEKQVISLDDVKIGYIVGLREDGSLFFDSFGSNKGLVEILGLHAYATKRVNAIYDTNQVAGDQLTREVGRGVAFLHQKVDVIQQVVAPKKPDNKIE